MGEIGSLCAAFLWPFLLSCSGGPTGQLSSEPANRRPPRQLIDLFDTATIRSGPLLLIAHRGGVIAENAPECSLNAIRLAAKDGYDLVELDVQESSDGEPMVFHEYDLSTACGVDKFIHELPAEELRQICYKASDQHIETLEEAFALCKDLKMGVMLDFKFRPDHVFSDGMFQRIARLIEQYDLARSAMTFWPTEQTTKYLGGRIMFSISGDELEQVKRGEKPDLSGKFYFQRPDLVPPELVTALQDCGALVIPAINDFLYPSHARRLLAKQDIEKYIEAGVDGLQIDSTFKALIPLRGLRKHAL